MSVSHDDDGNLQVTMSTLWGFVFKAACALAIPMMLMLLSWGTWVTVKVSAHDSDIAVLKARMDNFRHTGNTTQSVNVSAAEGVASGEIDQAARLRGYYLVSEVAAILRRDDRTVTQMCVDKKFPGAWRDKDTGSSPWKIPLGLLLGIGPNSGNLPLTAANNRKPEEEEEP